MILLKDETERIRFVKFAVVGSIGFGVDFLTFNLVRLGVGLSAEVSSVISFCAAVISNFLFNRYWTYPDSRTKPILRQLAQFAAVNIFGLIIRTIIFAIIKDPMISFWGMLVSDTDSVISSTVLGENISLAIVVIIVMFWNFFINRYWTYNDIQ